MSGLPNARIRVKNFSTSILQSLDRIFATIPFSVVLVLGLSLLAGVATAISLKAALFLLVLVGFLLFVLLDRVDIPIYLLIIFYTSNLMFVGMDELPTIPLGGGMDLQIHDVLTAALIVYSIFRLKGRLWKLLFFKPIGILVGMSLVSLMISMLLPGFSMRQALYSLRPLAAYGLYLGIVANFQSRKRLHSLLVFIFCIMFLTLGIQIYETANGQRIIAISRAVARLYWDISPDISVAGQSIPYIWNRATIYCYIVFFFSLGSIISIKGKRINWWYYVSLFFSFLVFILAMSRTWFVLIASGGIVIFLIGRFHLKPVLRTLVILSIIGLGFIGIIQAVGLEVVMRYMQLIGVRVASLLDIFRGGNLSFTDRVDIIRLQAQLFSKSPIFGFGYSNTALMNISSDVGIMNQLVRFGLVGLVPIVYLIYFGFRMAWKLWRSLPNIPERGWTLGWLGAWTGIVIGYLFNQDFFMNTYLLGGLVVMLAVLELISMLSLSGNHLSRFLRSGVDITK